MGLLNDYMVQRTKNVHNKTQIHKHQYMLYKGPLTFPRKLRYLKTRKENF